MRGGSPMESKLFEAFKKKLKSQSVPVLTKFNGEEEEFLSAANIFTLVLSRARELRKLGLSKGQVLLKEPSDFNTIVDFLACVKLGATYFPHLKEEQLKFVQQYGGEYDFERIDNGYILKGKLNWHHKDIYYPLVVATSGTKNRKIVSYHEKGLLFQLSSHEKVFRKFNFNHKLSLLPKNHCFGMVLDLLLGVFMGNYITFLDRDFTLASLKRIFKFNEIDFITCVPKHIDMLNEFAKKDSSLKSSLKGVTCFYGGAHLSSKSYDRAKQYFYAIVEGYGLTEAGPGVLINRQPIPGVEVSLVDQKLCLSSPSIGHYCGGNERLHTQDYFKKIKDKYIFLGREGDFIKNRSGKFESLFEIQEKINLRSENEILFVRDREKLILVDLYESKQLSQGLLEWVEKNYCAVIEVKHLPRSKSLRKISEFKCKSKEDAINQIIKLEGSWVS